MEQTNEQYVANKKNYDGESRQTFTIEEKRLWIPFGKISWAAIFAGVLVITVTQMLFSLLGMGIGISAIAPLQSDPNSIKEIGTATMIWWFVTMFISLFLGGLTTGKMYQTRSSTYLTWHGLLTWSSFTVFSFFMLTSSIGTLISGTGNIISTAVTTSASMGGTDNLDISTILRSAEGLLLNGTNGNQEISTEQNSSNVDDFPGQNTSSPFAQDAGRNTPYLLREIQGFFYGGNENKLEHRENLINALVNQTGMSKNEANNRVDQWLATYEELKAEAKIKADKAAGIISTASIIGFFALILGALVTIWGARVTPIKEHVPTSKAGQGYTNPF